MNDIKMTDSEDHITKNLRCEVFNYLDEHWIKEKKYVADLNRIWLLLKEHADVMTLTFTLQHIRVKVLKHPENWEFDCATAAHLMEKFEDRIQQDGERVVRKQLETLKELEKKLRELEYKQSYGNSYGMPKDNGMIPYRDEYRYAPYNPYKYSEAEYKQKQTFYPDDRSNVMKYFYDELMRKKPKL